MGVLGLGTALGPARRPLHLAAAVGGTMLLNMVSPMAPMPQRKPQPVLFPLVLALKFAVHDWRSAWIAARSPWTRVEFSPAVLETPAPPAALPRGGNLGRRGVHDQFGEGDGVRGAVGGVTDPVGGLIGVHAIRSGRIPGVKGCGANAGARSC